MSIRPTLVSAGSSASILTPDGRIPPDLWAEYAAIVLLEPEPVLLAEWIKRLEDHLGVTPDHRAVFARRTANAIDLDAKRLAFRHWFGIGDAQAVLLCMLYNAQGDFLTAEQLAVVESTVAGTVMVRVHRLRQAMDCEAIDSEAGPRYRLTEVGLAECKAAMLAFRESLA